mmetsp:Transcript_25487/g.55062  ORF Transcript_25487/g.55062 Transcript_25487/m.55062 type:complete len:163 (-) Transcript_25487:72-560(-)
MLEPGVLGRQTLLRESTGNGRQGAYAQIRKKPPGLQTLELALASALREGLGVARLGTESLLLRYVEGGVNFAHQDQRSTPYQAVVLLSEPDEDFTGGELFVSAPAYTQRRTAIRWKASGDCAIICASAAASSDSGSNWYHGMQVVSKGRREVCSRIALGLFQ